MDFCLKVLIMTIGMFCMKFNIQNEHAMRNNVLTRVSWNIYSDATTELLGVLICHKVLNALTDIDTTIMLRTVIRF